MRNVINRENGFNECERSKNFFERLSSFSRMLIEMKPYTVSKNERVFYNLNFLFVFFLQN